MKKILGMLFLACIMAFFGCKKDDSVTVSDEKNQQGETNDCFYFEAVDAGAVVSMVHRSYRGDADKAPDVSLEYSFDKSNWLPFVVGETNVSLDKAGDRIYIKAKDINDNFGFMYIDNIDSEEMVLFAFNSFFASERVKVGGNIMYLLDGTGKKTEFDTLSNKYVFSGLFWGMDKLTDASKLTLPAKTLTEYCYWSVFYQCSLLVIAPELPATTLAECCYMDMFAECTSLTVAPDLPATMLAGFCYESMFYGCTSLVVAPKLPATTLAECCYLCMFRNCTSLTVAPKMRATTLAEEGCYEMFEGCSSLQSIEVNFTEWTEYGTTRWLEGVSATGTFTCPAELDVTERGSSRIPEGWTIVTK